MPRFGLIALLLALIALALVAAVLFGETAFGGAPIAQAFAEPTSGPGEVLWAVRAPRAVTALMVGAALGLAGAVMQGLLRNPLADPGVLGVSAVSALCAALAIVLGWATVAGAVESAALVGAGLAGAYMARSRTNWVRPSFPGNMLPATPCRVRSRFPKR